MTEKVEEHRKAANSSKQMRSRTSFLNFFLIKFMFFSAHSIVFHSLCQMRSIRKLSLKKTLITGYWIKSKDSTEKQAFFPVIYMTKLEFPSLFGF